MRLADEMSRAVTAPGLEVKREAGGVIAISGKPVEHAMKAEHRREFVDRVFSIPGIEAVALHPDRARLRIARGAGSVPHVLRSLAKAMRSGKREQFAVADLELVEVLAPEKPIRLWRAGNRLTFLKVKALRPQRYRFFHPEFRDAGARRAILAELMGVAYVKERVGSGLNGGYIELEFQVGRMTVESLLGIVESALLGRLGSAGRTRLQPVAWRRHLVGTNFALALLSDFLFAPARLLSMVTLWMLNARHVEPALRSAGRGKPNLDTLYVTIACLTLLSMSFIGSAVMYWTFEFWPRQVKRLRETEMAKFLAQLKRCPRSVWVERDGTEMEVELSHLRAGDKVILRAGDVAPGDGVILSGEIDVAESWAAGTHRRQTGEVVYCSGRVTAGEARMRLVSPGQGAVTTRLAEWHTEAMAAPVSHERVKQLATSAVVPTLVLGAAAIFRGGISMAKGVIRPDYVTGPSIARELGWMASVMKAAKSGAFIGNDCALERLAECDSLVFSPGIAWRPGARAPEEIGAALHELGVDEILIPAGHANGALALLQKGIGETRPMEAGGLIRERRFLGKQVAFMGDCVAHCDAAAEADVAVHICHPPFHDLPSNEIALLAPDLDAVLALRKIATDYQNRLRGSFVTALVPNVACVIGAIYLGLPILGVVMLTNAGTMANYWRASRDVRAAGRRAE